MLATERDWFSQNHEQNHGVYTNLLLVFLQGKAISMVSIDQGHPHLAANEVGKKWTADTWFWNATKKDQSADQWKEFWSHLKTAVSLDFIYSLRQYRALSQKSLVRKIVQDKWIQWMKGDSQKKAQKKIAWATSTDCYDWLIQEFGGRYPSTGLTIDEFLTLDRYGAHSSGL